MNTQLATNLEIKYYSDKINKVSVSVIIKTDDNVIIGDLHIRPQNRIIDELCHNDPYLALTNAVIYDTTGKTRFKTHFMTVNTRKIVYIIPKDELIGNQNPATI